MKVTFVGLSQILLLTKRDQLVLLRLSTSVFLIAGYLLAQIEEVLRWFLFEKVRSLKLF